MQHKTIAFKNGLLSYSLSGEGKPLMLLHGFAEDSTIWNALIQRLPDYKIITPDTPGTGKSTMLSSPYNGIDDYAEAIMNIADEENLSSFCLIGHSMGGYIALAIAEKYPERLNSLGLFHSSAFADNDEKIVARKKSIDFIQNNGAAPFLRTTIPSLFTETFKRKHGEITDQLIIRGEQFTPEVLIQYYQAMIDRPDRTEVLRTFKHPVLFIIGEKDQAVPLDASLKQCYLPMISHVHILPNAAHMGMLEETEASARFLSTFYPAM